MRLVNPGEPGEVIDMPGVFRLRDTFNIVIAGYDDPGRDAETAAELPITSIPSAFRPGAINGFKGPFRAQTGFRLVVVTANFTDLSDRVALRTIQPLREPCRGQHRVADMVIGLSRWSLKPALFEDSL